MIRRSSCCRAAQRRRLVVPMSFSQVKCFKETSHNEKLAKNALTLSLLRGRPIARDDSLGKGNGGGNNQFCLAKGKVVALGRAGRAQSHTESNSMLGIENTIDERTLSRVLWPQHLPNINLYALYLWDM